MPPKRTKRIGEPGGKNGGSVPPVRKRQCREKGGVQRGARGNDITNDDGDEESEEGGAAVSGKREKVVSRNHPNDQSASVGVTGAAIGDILRGRPIRGKNPGRCADIVLQAVDAIPPIQRTVRAVGYENALRATAATLNCPAAEARHMLAATAAVDDQAAARGASDERAAHSSVGKLCTHKESAHCPADSCPAVRFRIVALGRLGEYAAEEGTAAEMVELQQCSALVWSDVLRLLGKKFLSLSSSEFVVSRVSFPALVAPPKASVAVINLGDSEEGVGYELKDSLRNKELFQILPGVVVRLQGGIKLEDSTCSVDMRAHLLDLAAGIEPGCAEAMSLLDPLTMGQLRSVLQKTIRVGAPYVVIPYQASPPRANSSTETPWHHHCEAVGAKEIRSSAVVLACLVLMGSHQGEFVFQIQQFVRGCTSALKRLAVVLVEDAWVSTEDVNALLACALLTKQEPRFRPPDSVWIRAFSAAVKALASCSCTVNDDCKGIAAMASTEKISLEIAATLLEQCGAGANDLNMFRTATQIQTWGIPRAPPVKVFDLFSWVGDESGKYSEAIQGEEGLRPHYMPLWHAFDHHPCRGISNLIHGDTVRGKIGRVWEQSGGNPRRRTMRRLHGPGSDALLIRAQQLLCYVALGIKVTATPSPELDATPVSLRSVIDTGVLAAAVGPIDVSMKGRGRFVAVLGTDDPADITIMVPPSRNKADLMPEGITDDCRESVLHEIQGKTLPCPSPFPLNGCTTQFHDGQWCVGSDKCPHKEHRDRFVPWESCRETSSVDVHMITGEPPKVPSVLVAQDSGRVGSNHGRQEKLCVYQSATEWLRGRCADMLAGDKNGRAILQRVANTMRQQTQKVKLPIPALDGGLGQNEMLALPLDSHAYLLLDEVALWFPGALRGAVPPAFSIQSTGLLRLVESVIRECLADARFHPDCKEDSWELLPESEIRRMMVNQVEVAGEILDRCRANQMQNMLVMDTGFGKTQAAAAVIRALIHEGRVNGPVIWITPRDALQSTTQELNEHCGVPAVGVSKLADLPIPFSKSFTMKGKRSRSGDLKDERPRAQGTFESAALARKVYVLQNDLVRQLCFADPWNVFVVVDEVHTCYNSTLRTSAAKDLCLNSVGFLAMTATPIKAVSNHEEHAQWMRACVQFPVSSKNLNWLVAASRIVSRRIELGIESAEEVRVVKLPPSSSLDRYVTRLRARDWLGAATILYECLEAHVVAIVDEELVRTGGVLVEVRTRSDAERMVQKLGAHRAACLPEAASIAVQSYDSQGSGAAKGNAIGKGKGKGKGKANAASATEYFEAGPKPIAVVTSAQCHGYNWASRLGSLVRCEFPGNAAQRRQMRGRIKRLGQPRKRVRYVTVLSDGGIDQALWQRHQAADHANASLESMAKEILVEDLVSAILH